MKSKIEIELDKPDENQGAAEESEAIEVKGPDVASGKGSKVTLIAASAILIAVVLYFLFFSGGSKEKKDQDLSPVTSQDFSGEAPANPADLSDFNSLFDEDQKKNTTKEDVILETPDVPDVPVLPDIFSDVDKTKDSVLPAFLDLPDAEKKSTDVSKIPGAPTQQTNQEAPPGQTPTGGLFSINPTNDQTGGVVPVTPKEETPEEKKKSVPPIIVVAGGPGPSNSVGYEKNIISLNKDPVQDLKETTPQISSQYISDRSTTLIQGKILTAVLETAINTEFPGEVRGIISRDVYAEAGDNILIPRGSRIYGSYSSKVVRGQARVTINWTRLIRPDGIDAAIAFNASDQFGRAGIEGDVDNKYGSIITNSILTSVLAVGGAIAAEKLSGDSGTTTTTDPTSGTTTKSGSASSQAIYDVSKAIIDTVGEVIGNTIDLSPVIRVPQGTKVTIVVNSDMSLPQFKK